MGKVKAGNPIMGETGGRDPVEVLGGVEREAW
jgi:hypothetical protein